LVEDAPASESFVEGEEAEGACEPAFLKEGVGEKGESYCESDDSVFGADIFFHNSVL
jgi:hypothetical protein